LPPDYGIGSRLANAWERGLHLMEEVSEAMIARGFRGEARFPPGSRFGVADWALVVAITFFCAAIHFV